MPRIALLLASLLLFGCTDAIKSAPTDDKPSGAVELTKDANLLDTSCTEDADCAVKNVGNCCGYFPACVNKDSPTFPDQVKAQCEKDGMASICGFREISSCTCSDGQCKDTGASIGSPGDVR